MFRRTRPFTTLALLAALAFQPLAPALAGTVGALSGTVTQSDTKAPIAGAKVVVASPSGTFRATQTRTGSSL